ncbi:hypothetical protein FACS1894122_13980 [Alphaproteobacteria bacterium]|nr:hypothetical protein FACS1894122_13980 [Alphaproteobacteria bacterium]
MRSKLIVTCTAAVVVAGLGIEDVEGMFNKMKGIMTAMVSTAPRPGEGAIEAVYRGRVDAAVVNYVKARTALIGNKEIQKNKHAYDEAIKELLLARMDYIGTIAEHQAPNRNLGAYYKALARIGIYRTTINILADEYHNVTTEDGISETDLHAEATFAPLADPRAPGFSGILSREIEAGKLGDVESPIPSEHQALVDLCKKHLSPECAEFNKAYFPIKNNRTIYDSLPATYRAILPIAAAEGQRYLSYIEAEAEAKQQAKDDKAHEKEMEREAKAREKEREKQAAADEKERKKRAANGQIDY